MSVVTRCQVVPLSSGIAYFTLISSLCCFRESWFGCIIFRFQTLLVFLQWKYESVCYYPYESNRYYSSSLSSAILSCRAVKVFSSFFAYLGRFLILVLLYLLELDLSSSSPFLLFLLGQCEDGWPFL